MRKTAIGIVVLAVLGVTLTSCYSAKYTNPSKTKFRAFISNRLHALTIGNTPAIEIMNATLDQLSFSPIGLNNLQDAGPMDLAVDKKLVAVYSPASNAFSIIDTATEQVTMTTSALPDLTESFFIAVDNKHLYAAVPNAPVTGFPPGAVIQIDLSSGSISATISVPGVRTIARDRLQGHILAFSDGSDSITVIDPTKIGTSTDPRTAVPGFDRPVNAVFIASGTPAYILNCGAPCGGTAASVTLLNLTDNSLGASVPVPAARAAAIAGSTIYVVGTPAASEGNDCGASNTSHATTCGRVSVLDGLSMTLVNTANIFVTDGIPGHVELGSNGELYVGATDCTNINIPASGSDPGETRGCLAIVDTKTFKTVFPPASGDVTGIAPIPGRNVVYVIQAAELAVYDTTTAQLLPNRQTDIVGQLVDVKIPDNPPN